jgi:hypothetical protein
MTEIGARDSDVRQRIFRIASTKLTGPMAKKVAPQMEARLKLMAFEGKPILLLGVRFNGEMLSTKAWRGKVILATFWASTDQASRDAMADWRKWYQQYHKTGLEVVGIACDENPQQLIQFLQSQPGMVWPQLFDKTQPGMHAMALELGVTELPTVMVIDKNGICRGINLGAGTEPMIKRLLAE